ncbi:VPS10 domain-containing protein [Persicitalea jodogahamensis]|uniref:VPS10 domain-containing protein n=1 Tax=Persicitalea jodogahamensis TaxID=402147 RepID=UPI001672BB78|nr:glycosyl hydrolase [Persicitalea jodogahamensis]
MQKWYLLGKAYCLPFLLFAALQAGVSPAFSQKKSKSAPAASKRAESIYGNDLLKGLEWRNIGPFRGGRSTAVTGVIGDPYTYYFGACGGGVWKSTNGGNDWFAVSDSTFKASSVGAIAVAPSNANVVYAGTGETDIRGNISYGDGMYKSTDAGKTWRHIGLEKGNAIANIQVHPTNPELVYVSAMGNIFGTNPERGVYRSKDGGDTWKLVLARNDSTGAVDVKMDPNNSNVLYAALWQAYRNHFSMSSGGTGSGLFKSVDGGDTWKEITKNPGMPKGILGKIGLSVSPVNSNRIYAMIENKEKGGLYRSEDAGATWKLINEDPDLKQRPWYYMNVAADPKNENGLIVLNVNAFKSIDGGKSFTEIDVHHGDTHDVWINPDNPENFIIGDDGGGEVTFNGGGNFTELDIPTAQFYHVHTDNQFPYNIYGAQQDNSTVRIASRSNGYTIGTDDWWPVAGGESGYVVEDPLNPDITYGGSYDGFLSVDNHKTGERRLINVYPEFYMGHGSDTREYRFQWTYPIMFSPHDPNTMYVTSQYVHKSTDRGQSWEKISPDLTRHDPATMGASGGPISKDNTGVETYATIFAFEESTLEKGVFYAASDDGLLHISKDSGKSWENITPKSSLLPEFALMSIVEVSPHDPATVYLAATRYKLNDFKPYLLKSTDYGKSWKLITDGIPADQFTRVIREDPNKKDFLYAGTEQGIWASFDGGDSWQSLQLNLPTTPIHDLVIQKREKDIVVATHGRSFWILDDISPLHQITKEIAQSDAHLFKPSHAYRMSGGSRKQEIPTAGQNPPNGAVIRCYMKEVPKEELRMHFLTAGGDTVSTYSSLKDKKGEPIKISKEFYTDETVTRPGTLPTQAGTNVFVWDMRYADATKVEGTNVMWSGSIIGAKAVPGTYQVHLYAGNKLIGKENFEILKDPRIKATDEDFKAQFELAQKINDKLSMTHEGINKIRSVRKQIGDYMKSVKDSTVTKQLKELSKPMLDELEKIENTLMQPKSKAGQDPLNFPIQLNDKLAGVKTVVMSGDSKPTKSSYEAYENIAQKIDTQLDKLSEILNRDIPTFNNAARQTEMKAIIVN